MKKAILSLSILFAMAALFLYVGRGACLSTGVAVSLGLKYDKPVGFEIFWTEAPGEPFSQAMSRSIVVPPGGRTVSLWIPARQVENLRVDFGSKPGNIRASALSVTGSDARTLDWHDFSARRDIAAFSIDSRGAVDVVVSGSDAYAILDQPLGLDAGTRVSHFKAICLLLLAALFWIPLAGPEGVLWTASPRVGEPVCSRAFVTLVLLIVGARFALSARLPPCFFLTSWDDIWFLNAADSLLKGEWMGAYDNHTLIKGCFGPMVLAASSFLGVPFLVAETFLYVLSCLFFVGVCSRFSRNRLFLAAAFALLVFNPLSMAAGTFQRIYRNGMPLWQVPILFGCLLLVFLDARRSWRTLAMRAVAAGAAIWMIQNTREDGVWIWPFVFACLALAAVRAWRSGETRRIRAGRAFLCSVPLWVFLLGNVLVCLVNWRFYGLPLRNDRDAGNYAKAMQDLYLIEPDPEDEDRLTGPEHERHYHVISWSTICKAFEASPTLRRERRGIEFCFDNWAKGAGYHGRDLFEDKPLFAIRNGVASSGVYSSLPKSESFWAAVHGELAAAFKNGRLRKRGFSPTAMCAPFRAKDAPRVFREWLLAVYDAARFHDTRAMPCHAEPWWERMDWNERLLTVPGDRFFTEETVARERPFIDRANRVGDLYTTVMPFVLAVAVLAFAVATVRLARGGTLKDLDSPATAAWLFAAGVMASLLLHTVCIAYVSATTFRARFGLYMTSSYQLELMFVVAVVALFLQTRNGSNAKTLAGTNGKH